jgi:hypothetical protein
MNIVIQLYRYNIENSTSIYQHHQKIVRQMELQECLVRNLNNSIVKSLHILVESYNDINYYKQFTDSYKEKVHYTIIGHQPTYKEFLLYVKDIFQPGEIVAIMNSDMFYNSNFNYNLLERKLTDTMMIALTRHEFTDENHTICHEGTCPFTVHGGSCDTFIFKTPISEKVDLDLVDHKQNLFGGENVFMYAWVKAGYTILNPCDQLITVHRHEGRVHLEKYDTIGTEETRILNLKTRFSDDNQ